MTKRKESKKQSGPRWMTECDVIRYNLKLPQDLKDQIKKESSDLDMTMSTYICGLLSGEIKRKKYRK